MIRNVLSVGQSMNYLIGTVLSSFYKLTIVEDVFHGMLLLKQKKDFQLIIVDLDYQTKDTMDFILHINSSKLYNQRIIVLSGAQNFRTHEQALKSRIHERFIKPFNPIDLVNAIDKINVQIPSPSLS